MDRLYYINLDKRKDRLQHLEENVLSFIEIDNKQRVSAVDNTDYDSLAKRGAGCSLSHIKVWEDAINNEYNKILIMEDDFEFIVEPAKFNKVLKDLEHIDYSICNLSYNDCSPLVETEVSGFYNCDEIQTTSCYAADVDFLKTMLPTISEAVEKMMNNQSHATDWLPYYYNAIDMVWKPFQKRQDWIVSERVGRQKGSISDIERKYVDYGV